MNFRAQGKAFVRFPLVVFQLWVKKWVTQRLTIFLIHRKVDASANLRTKNDSNVGDPYGNRTRVAGVRGRSLNRLTNGPQSIKERNGAPPGTRTRGPLIKSQLLYQLS